MRSDKILKGQKEIEAFLGMSWPTILKLIEKYRLPVSLIEGCWYAHAGNLEKYFEDMTRIGSPEKVHENGV